MQHGTPYLEEHLLHLRRKYQPARRLATHLFDPIALIDVALILAVVFLVAPQFRTRPGVEISLPATPSVSQVPFDASRVLSISKERVMFFDNERISFAGLKNALQELAFRYPGEALLIQADESVSHRDLMNIYGEASAAGVPTVALIGQLPSETVETTPTVDPPPGSSQSVP